MTIFNKTIQSVIIFLIITVTINPAVADYIAGEEANKKGDRVTAFKEFHRAAQGKDKRAYGKLGSMYLYGLGTEKDFTQAYIWFHLAYLTGERTGERFRDAASSMLPRDQYLIAKEAAEALRIEHKLGTSPPH